jgi:subtilisin family serine protease
VVSTIPQNDKPKQFGTMTGTSQATPLVSGLLARLMSDYPEATITEIADLVRKGANRKGPLNDPEKFGVGMIDVQNTYKLAAEHFKK